MTGLCACGAPAAKYGKTGRCRSCVARAMNADPIVIARRRVKRWGDWSQADFALYQDLCGGRKVKAAEAKRLVLEHRAARGCAA